MYLISLRRRLWYVALSYPDMVMIEEYTDQESTWMAQFRGNSLHLLRQARRSRATAATPPLPSKL